MKNSPDTIRKRNDLRSYWMATVDRSSFPQYVKRECNQCKLIRPCKWSSQFTQTGKPVYRNKCDECYRKYGNQRRKITRKRVNNLTRVRKNNRKQKCIDYLGGKCEECGYDDCPKALTFAHKDPLQKDFSIARILDYSWETVKAELDKCRLLCFNCHMEEECERDRNEEDAYTILVTHRHRRRAGNQDLRAG